MLAAGHTETFNFRKCSHGMPVLATYRRRSSSLSSVYDGAAPGGGPALRPFRPETKARSQPKPGGCSPARAKNCDVRADSARCRTPWLDKDLVIAAIIVRRAHGSQQPRRPSDPEIA
jgi:hypothetical protein